MLNYKSTDCTQYYLHVESHDHNHDQGQGSNDYRQQPLLERQTTNSTNSQYLGRWGNVFRSFFVYYFWGGPANVHGSDRCLLLPGTSEVNGIGDEVLTKEIHTAVCISWKPPPAKWFRSLATIFIQFGSIRWRNSSQTHYDQFSKGLYKLTSHSKTGSKTNF